MNYAESYRLARALGLGAVLFVAIVAMWWARSHPPTSLDRTTATVTEVLESGLGTNASRLVRVVLEDGREGRVMIPTFAARGGAEIPLIVESHRNGGAYLSFDADAWVDGAGS